MAYLRFASVYQAFESLEDFESAIALLRHESDVEAKAATRQVEGKGSEGKSPEVKNTDAKNTEAKTAAKSTL